MGNLHRTLYLFGCNNLNCSKGWNGTSVEIPKHSFRCFRSQVVIQKQNKVKDITSSSKNDENYWSITEENNSSTLNLQELEEALTNLEYSSKSTKQNKTLKNKSNNISKIIKCCSSFPFVELEWRVEPRTDSRNFCQNNFLEDSDDDCFTESVDELKIQMLLDKYLEEEDDEEIKKSIQQSFQKKKSLKKHINLSEKIELYERLPPKQQAFYLFTSRIKRTPNQVLRYAYGGLPMWSIPCQKTNSMVPNCKCGAKREFEFQFMPSILHILNVDLFVKNHLENSKKMFIFFLKVE